jgi:predicted nucleotidyltransferase
VFELFSDRHRTARVDVFLEEPFDLDEILARALREEVAPGVEVPFLGLEDLVSMKLEAGRPQDLVDVEKLRQLGGRSDEPRE